MDAGSSQSISSSQIRPFDVVLGRGKTTYIHPGNDLYRKEVKARSDDYHGQSAVEKDATARAIISLVEGKEGRFLRLAGDGENWLACSQETVRSKVKQALRDAARMRRKKKGGRGVGKPESLAAESAVNLNVTHVVRNAEDQAFAGLGTVAGDLYLPDLRNNGEGNLQSRTQRPAFQIGLGSLLNYIEQWNQTVAAGFLPLSASYPSVLLVSSQPTQHQQNLARLGLIYSGAPAPSMLGVSVPQPSLEPLPFFKLPDVKREKLDPPSDTRNPI